MWDWGEEGRKRWGRQLSEKGVPRKGRDGKKTKGKGRAQREREKKRDRERERERERETWNNVFFVSDAQE